MSDRRLVRAKDDRLFLGVAAGIARYFNIDPVIVRIIFIIAGLASAGHAILAYLLLAVLMPNEATGTAGKAHAFDPEEEIIIKETF